jgi:hypothetical protein
MPKSADAAEAIYIELFGSVAENADYFEPEEGVDFLLAETLIASIAVTILTSFIGGAFEELGRSLVEKLKTRIFRGEKLIEATPSDVVAELAKLLQNEAMTADRIALGQSSAQQKLQELGLTSDVARKLAAELAASVRNHHAT